MSENSAALELIVAVAENSVIGRGNQLPWRLPADLRHFKSLTMGKHLLMGRKTYESIGKALPGRINIVLSRSPHFNPGDCMIVGGVDAAVLAAGSGATLMVIGGSEIYRQCLARAACIHLTLVHAVIQGDVYFDGWRGAEWRETSRVRHEADATHQYAYSFVTLERGGGVQL